MFQHKKRVEVVLNYLCENYDPRWKIHIITHHYICSQKKEKSGFVRHLARKKIGGFIIVGSLASLSWFIRWFLLLFSCIFFDWFFSLCYFMESYEKSSSTFGATFAHDLHIKNRIWMNHNLVRNSDLKFSWITSSFCSLLCHDFVQSETTSLNYYDNNAKNKCENWKCALRWCLIFN